MITINDIYIKAVEIAQANPDFNYKEWAETQESLGINNNCVYFLQDNTPGCLFGHAFNAFGIDQTGLRNLNDTAIDPVIDFLVTVGVIKDESAEGVLDKMIAMQEMQDTGATWGTVVDELITNGA